MPADALRAAPRRSRSTCAGPRCGGPGVIRADVGGEWAATVALATVAQTLYRPAHSALLPSICGTPQELTSPNVVRGLLDSLATLLGPTGSSPR